MSATRYRRRHPADVRADTLSCPRKKHRYPTQRNAQILARALGYQYGKRYAEYRCIACGFFHLRTRR